MTNQEIITRGELIRDETVTGANTAQRVGEAFVAIGENLQFLDGKTTQIDDILEIESHPARTISFITDSNYYVNADGEYVQGTGVTKMSYAFMLYKGECVEFTCKLANVGVPVVMLTNEEGTSFTPVVYCTNKDDLTTYTYTAKEDCYVCLQYFTKQGDPVIHNDSARLVDIEDRIHELESSTEVLEQSVHAASNAIAAANSKISEIQETLFVSEDAEETILSPIRNVDGATLWNVSSETGEFVQSSSNNVHATEIQLNSNIKTISYVAKGFIGDYGYAFLDSEGNLIHAVKTTTDGEITIDAARWIAQGATKFRCGTEIVADYIQITVVSEIKESKVNELRDSIFEEQVNLRYEELDVPVRSENNSKKWNVSSVDGSFVESNSTNVRAIEISLDSDVVSIEYQAAHFAGNYGYAFLYVDDEEVEHLVAAVHTQRTTANDPLTWPLTVDASEYIEAGANRFRCANTANTDTIHVVVSHFISKQEINKIDAITNKEHFSLQAIKIQFDTQRIIPNNIFGLSDQNAVTFQNHTGYGLLGLAYDYLPYGKPSKLAIFFHGAGGYTNHSSADFQSDMKPYIDFMRMSGYTVLAPYAWDETTNYHAFASPYSIANFGRAVKHVIDNYNVESDGVYIWGRSAGGSAVLTFAYNSGIKVKAIALHHALIGAIKWEHATSASSTPSGNDMVKKYIFDDDANYEWTREYLTANFHKIVPFENMFNGLIDPNVSITDKVNFLLNDFNVDTWKSYVRNLPFPCKIWAAADDGDVPYDNLLIFHQQVINGGGNCEFRQLPSDYTDSEVIEANNHHVADTHGPRSTVTTKLGYEVTISNAYIETVEWFDRF